MVHPTQYFLYTKSLSVLIPLHVDMPRGVAAQLKFPFLRRRRRSQSGATIGQANLTQYQGYINSPIRKIGSLTDETKTDILSD